MGLSVMGVWARHMVSYLKGLNLPFRRCENGRDSGVLLDTLSSCSHILILISDDAIADFYRTNSWLTEKLCVHFSGTVCHPQIVGVHPLMTFHGDLYEIDFYGEIPFVLEKGRGFFSDFLPGLKNPHWEIDPEKKSLYHSYCVLEVIW